MTEDKDTPEVQERVWTPYDLNPSRQLLRTLVHSYYDWQKPRIAAKQRGVKSLKRAVRKEVQEAAHLGDTVGSHLTLPRSRKEKDFPPVELTPEQILALDELATVAEQSEKRYMKQIENTIPAMGAAGDWLLAQPGIGPAMAGYCLATYDPYRAARPSSFWQFTGVGELCTCSKSPRPHSMHRMAGRKNPYNADARTKLIGVLAPGILKACVRKAGGEKDDTYEEDPQWELMNTDLGQRWVRGSYARTYFNYRHRILSRPDKDTNWGYQKKDGKRVGVPANRQAAATRYMVKMFLLDLWKVMREAEGLPIVAPYHEAQRGYGHKEAVA